MPHFVLKNPKGDDLLHVNKSEVIVSALQYSPQLQSLFVGYNFGAFQIWNMHNLKLSYTSSVHETHMPIFNFAIQVKNGQFNWQNLQFSCLIYRSQSMIPEHFVMCGLFTAIRFFNICHWQTCTR